jgi:ParB family chromosome partitioning protein
VQEVFDGLGLMNWLSFTTSRLPLLNLPEEILVALRSGQIAYTKAIAISRVKDEEKRQQLLQEALAHNWSLSQIKERIKALDQASLVQEEAPSPQLPNRLKDTYQRIKKRRLWEDPKKRKQLETLLTKLEALLGDA